MAWMQKLYETYERCQGQQPPGSEPLPPISHTTQKAQVEIVIDGTGNFRRAQVVERNDSDTLVPCTEASAGRSGTRPVSHPLCDKLQYIAADFARFGGEVTSGFEPEPEKPHQDYVALLTQWTQSNHSHPKLRAILDYVKRGHVVADLVREGILPVDDSGTAQPRLRTRWAEDKMRHRKSSVLSNNQSPSDAFVRWRVEEPGNPVTATWEDRDLIESWTRRYESMQTSRGICMVTGTEGVLAEQHPVKLRNGADKAKLISSNDTSGFTFRGRFLDADQAAGVGYEVTQKAHNALRWLIERQGHPKRPQITVAWAVTGNDIPNPLKNSHELFDTELSVDSTESAGIGDVGQAFSHRFNRLISGYRTKLGPADSVVVLALDSATPGRMAISFYRELNGSEYLDRIEGWHTRFAWVQNYSSNLRFVGAPSPPEIALAAYGRRLDPKLRKATIERLLPCIVDARPVPFDLVASAVRRSSNRTGLPHWEWAKTLGIACSLFKGRFTERGYQMDRELERTTRDYLYGRLLAIAEEIEGRALYVAGERRETTAARYMQRFADRPFSTWRFIEPALSPYKTRLRASRAGFLHKMETLLDEVVAAFAPKDFQDDRPLSGEFLLGYHCERRQLHASLIQSEIPQNPDQQSGGKS